MAPVLEVGSKYDIKYKNPAGKVFFSKGVLVVSKDDNAGKVVIENRYVPHRNNTIRGSLRMQDIIEATLTREGGRRRSRRTGRKSRRNTRRTTYRKSRST